MSRRKRHLDWSEADASNTASANLNPITLSQFHEALLLLCPDVTFTRNALEALRFVQDDFVHWIVAATTSAADDRENNKQATTVVTTESEAAAARPNDISPSIKKQDILNALEQDSETSSTVLTRLSEQIQNVLDNNNNNHGKTDDMDAAKAVKKAEVAARLKKARRTKYGREFYMSEEMAAAQEQLLQGSRQKMAQQRNPHK